ncbi:MAG: hypothetical protein ABIH23_06650 [bacterium]
MQDLLVAIAKQAGLDRVLFTPAVKQLYFEMAVASGGVTQFKHAETTRKGLSYAADKADDKKRALLFCGYQELCSAYDQFIQIANDLLPLVILVIRDEIRGESQPNVSPLFLRDTGWIQFWTHTYQEAYDHLALGYLLHEEKKIRLPVMVVQSEMSGGGSREFSVNEELNLGNPMKGLESSRAGKTKMTFEEAFARMEKKKEPPTLPRSYEQLIPALPELYKQCGYEASESSFPVVGKIGKAKVGILSLLPGPADIERDGYKDGGTKCAFLRPLCYRPLVLNDVIKELAKLDALAVVEPATTPGIPKPPFCGEVAALLPSSASTRLRSVTIPTAKAVLDEKDIARISDELRVTNDE